MANRFEIQARRQDLAGTGQEGYADGPSTQAAFYNPSGVCMDERKNVIIADSRNNCIRQINPEGRVSTIAGGGIFKSFNEPIRVCMDRKQNIIVAENLLGDIKTIAGSGKQGYQDGYQTAASFNRPMGVCVDKLNNIIVADSLNNRIRKISPSGQVTTVAGSGKDKFQDGEGILASFDWPEGVCIDNDENIIVADHYNDRERETEKQRKSKDLEELFFEYNDLVNQQQLYYIEYRCPFSLHLSYLHRNVSVLIYLFQHRWFKCV